jgi:hypothetical protein
MKTPIPTITCALVVLLSVADGQERITSVPVIELKRTTVFEDIEEQRRLLARIKQAGGLFLYDFEYNTLFPNGVHKFFDVQRDCDVVCVEMDSANLDGTSGVKHESIDEALVAEICRLSRLKKLRLPKTTITDNAMKAICALPELEKLDLVGAKITDTHVRRIASITTLKSLRLSSCKISDAPISELARMQNLETLYLDGTLVTDVGVLELQRSPKLTALYIHDSGVGFTGVESLLSKAKSIKHIGIGIPTITPNETRLLHERFPAVQFEMPYR